MSWKVKVLAFCVAIIHCASPTSTLLGAQDDQVLGYDAKSETLMVLAMDESKKSRNLSWYREGVLVHSRRAVGGALLKRGSNACYAVLQLSAGLAEKPRLEIEILNEQFTVSNSRDLSADIDWLARLDEQEYRLSVLQDGSIVITIRDRLSQGNDQCQFLVLIEDLSSYSLNKHIGNGTLVSVSERDLVNFDFKAKERFKEMWATQSQFGTYSDPSRQLRFNGRNSAFVVDFDRFCEITGYSTVLDRTSKLQFDGSHVIATPGNGAGAFEPISNLFFDAADPCVWYSVATMMNPEVEKSVLELQCQLGVSYSDAMKYPIFRVYDRDRNHAIRLRSSLEQFLVDQDLFFHAVIDSEILDENQFGVLLQLYTEQSDQDPYRYAVLRISRDGSFELQTVFTSRHSFSSDVVVDQSTIDQIQRKLRLMKDGSVVKWIKTGSCSLLHYSNEEWREVVVPTQPEGK